MHHFHYHNDSLFCEDIPLERIAKEQGTPCYIYSHATLTRHFQAYDQAFASVPHIIAFAMICGTEANAIENGEKEIVPIGQEDVSLPPLRPVGTQ